MSRIRHGNIAMRFKIETTEGTDSVPDASNAFPFEVDSVEYNSPTTSEASQEANGSLAAGAALIVGQPAEITFRVRMKGAGAGTVYTSGVRPPHHDLLQACGWRGVFTPEQASAVIQAGTVNSLTAPVAYAATPNIFRGMPMQLTGGNSGGRLVHVTNYTNARVASLTDIFGAALNTSVSVQVLANWTYAPTSPADLAARVTDHPSGTLYIYEDGVLRRFTGLRGMVDFAGETARPGFMTFRLMGTFVGKSDVARPLDNVPQNSAPTLANGASGINNSLLLNGAPLAVRQWALNTGQAVEVSSDPNTPFGFGAADIDRRDLRLSLDPADTLVSVRNVVADIRADNRYTGVVRCGSVVGNRWSLVFPVLQPVDASPGKRGIYRTEELSLKAVNVGQGPSGIDADALLCFY